MAKTGYENISEINNGDQTTEGKVTCILTCVVWLITCAAIITVPVCLIVAYAKDLGGEVKIKHVDHTPCDLEVDPGSARRISNLIHNVDVKHFYLNLQFPNDVVVNRTNNIFQEKSMVWTFEGNPGTKHFLDLPWMYFVWSVGLLDHDTYRNLTLEFIIKGSRECSLFLGTNKTTQTIVKALRDLTINITEKNDPIDKDVMKSVWCQTYFEENIDTTFKNFANIFRFYYSDFRYLCSKLDFNYISGDYDVITDDKFRPFNRQWSSLAFVFSIVCLWFFPLLLYYSECSTENEVNIYLGSRSPITFVDILWSPFQDCRESCSCTSDCFCCSDSSGCCGSSGCCDNSGCSDSSCCCGNSGCFRNSGRFGLTDVILGLKCVGAFVVLYVLFPSGMIITYIINELDPKAKSMLSDLDKRDNNTPYAWYIPKSMWWSKAFTSTALPLTFYLGLSFLFLPYTIYVRWNGTLFPKGPENDAQYKKQRSLFSFFPWFFVTWKLLTNKIDCNCGNCSKCECRKKRMPLACFLKILFPPLFIWWICCLLLVLFKSLMFFCMLFSFGILSIVTFPTFISGIFTYIFTGVLFAIRRVQYPRHKYHKLLTLVIKTMKKDDTLKDKCQIDKNGDLGISKTLFCQLVNEHQPMVKMLLNVLAQVVFVGTLLIWTGLWIRDLNQWREIGIFKDILFAGLLYNIPNILHALFPVEDDKIIKRRLVKSIRDFYSVNVNSAVNGAVGGGARATGNGGTPPADNSAVGGVGGGTDNSRTPPSVKHEGAM